ncbi:MAG: lipoyl(octanoyl) transferase LipB [Gammaproteobacteria bacterium]|nr:lipoyl(octanoyl) transferase LipB [Gammaproteobacteria bacterium]
MTVTVRHRGMLEYTECYQEMVGFSLDRQHGSPDEIWCLQHPPVYTLGLNASREHLSDPGDIPVVQTDRGGQVTYHGPGQLIVYCLLDMQRKPYGVKALVQRLEQSLIDLLASYDIHAARRPGAPGVYVDNKKIAALGIRVKRGFSWHGLALNVDMDLLPFEHINPCGYAGLKVTQLRDLGFAPPLQVVAEDLLPRLQKHLETDDTVSDVDYDLNAVETA